MRATAVGIGAAAGMGAIGSTAAPAAAIDWNDVGTIAASTVVGGPVGLGWALRETEVLGSNPPAEGLTAGALKQQFYQAARTRQSENASTFVDNQNIIDNLDQTAYTEGKIAAIEKLNAGAPEQEVVSAAQAASNSHFATIEKNLLKSWNESVAELQSFLSTVDSHPDVSRGDIWNYPASIYSAPSSQGDVSNYGSTKTTSHTLADGSSFDVTRLGYNYSGSTEPGDRYWSPVGYSMSNGDHATHEFYWTVYINNPGGGKVGYLSFPDWNDVYSQITTVAGEVESGLSTWVTGVYGDVQSGEIDISNLLTPRERAEMMAGEETEAQAIADLAALNIPIDPEREATITIPATGATLSGTIGLTDPSDGPIESGTTYDPSTFTGDVYLTADVSQITGTWDAFQTGVDGGTITLTSSPYEGVILDVTTTAGETVSVPASDWTDNGDGTWSYDASAELETTTTEVDSVAYASADSEPQFETLRLSQEFTVAKLTNKQTGEEADSATFESSEPQSDSNYITQEEWNQLEEQNQELIDKYEESQNGGGGGGGGGGFLPEDQNWGLIAAGAGAAAIGWGYITGGDQ